MGNRNSEDGKEDVLQRSNMNLAIASSNAFHYDTNFGWNI